MTELLDFALPDGGAEPGEAPPQPLASAAAISAAHLATAVQVLQALGGDVAAFTQPRFRGLRLALRPLYALEAQRFCSGLSVEQYRDRHAQQVEAKTRKLRKAQLDKQLINSTRLRQQRLQALKLLQQRAAENHGAPGALVGVPDGPAVSVAEQLAAALPAIGPKQQQEPAAALTYLFRSCYTCKARFTELHHFYDMLCPSCAPLNYAKRLQSADCRGRVAVVTGGRVKIGYHIALKLLRAGAVVVVTTRFPHDGIERLAREPDFASLQHRIQYYGLDLRDLAAVEGFCQWMKAHYPRLDVLINNACQTIRRPPAFYRHLIEGELQPATDRAQVVDDGHLHSAWLGQLLGGGAGAALAPAPAPLLPQAHPTDALARRPPRHLPVSALAAVSTQIPTVLEDDLLTDTAELFPDGVTDVHQQQLDLRKRNSWVLKLAEVSTPEAAEVMAVNALSPFVLNGKLKPLLLASPAADRFIVNVSAMEGKFYRYKTPNHPHTNMAKAALNMMTRTAAEDYAKVGIYMSCVDTGWINDENPLEKAAQIAESHNFQTPIDEVDAAARVLDPVFHALNTGERIYGKFLKDYAETEW